MRYDLVVTPHYSDVDDLPLSGGLRLHPDLRLIGMTIRVERDDGAFAQFDIGPNADPHMLTLGVGTDADLLTGLRALVNDANELHELRARLRPLHPRVADGHGGFCSTCQEASEYWPCPTIQALGDAE